jgi:predicted nuclease of predicted toxin-antitoxin system
VRFLIDNALPPRLALLLREAGYNAVHVRDYGMQASRDDVILERARDDSRILISADTDFGALLAAQNSNRPSFILFREADLVSAEDYAERLVVSLSMLEPDLDKGCVVVFRAGRIRVRNLPFSD